MTIILSCDCDSGPSLPYGSDPWSPDAANCHRCGRPAIGHDTFTPAPPVRVGDVVTVRTRSGELRRDVAVIRVDEAEGVFDYEGIPTFGPGLLTGWAYFDQFVQKEA